MHNLPFKNIPLRLGFSVPIDPITVLEAILTGRQTRLGHEIRMFVWKSDVK